jgi:hypothetical protein
MIYGSLLVGQNQLSVSFRSRRSTWWGLLRNYKDKRPGEEELGDRNSSDRPCRETQQNLHADFGARRTLSCEEQCDVQTQQFQW